ncbi:ABC transporter family protein [Muricomes intestini]|uniref:ABC transporter family protein n=1 Tax=Muricomes intestini TaxID=1796634 RepID=A0A4R3K3T9_9FIRM|nr:ABC transporter family protein [Muricomes intestini]
MFEDISFYVRKGEIVGFAGLVGAGRTETMRAVFGLDPHDSGVIRIEGKETQIKSPSDSIEHKLVMLSESRRDDGIVPVRSVMENASLASLNQFIYGGYAHRAKERSGVKESFLKMNVKTPTLDTAISSLSGGNQQKVLLSRWMLCNPDIMILDEPTRGIDVGAKFEIYKLITDIVKENKAVIMVSSELPELIGMCDRIYIMCQGRISGCISKDAFSQETIMKHAAGLVNEDSSGGA